MRIERVEVREIALDLLTPFETSFGRTTSRRILLVRVEADGIEGWGESTASEGPYFNEEFTESAWHAIGDFLAPLLLSSYVAKPEEVAARFDHIRGNRMARAAVETAVWDLDAKRAGVPLWRHLGGVRPSIACGVSIGLQPSLEQLLERVEREVRAGYQRIKLKIAPGRDVALVAAVRERFPRITLSVDANSAYSLEQLDLLGALERFHLLMIEQPLRPGDLLDHAKLQAALATPVCLDESIVDDESARQAIEIAACRIVNVKLGRVGGHTVARAVAARCAEAGIPVWCGGMLESGVGRLHNAAMSSLAPFTLPGDVSDSRRYWARDVVEPRPTVEKDGTMRLPSAPGIGADVDLDFVEGITVRRRIVEP
jgi:O-succinylbenzoate synthase